MEDFTKTITALRSIAPQDAVRSIIDIAIVTYVTYRLLMLVKGTRAWRLIIGILIFMLVVLVSERLKLQTLHWVLLQVEPLIPFALVVLLLPEVRQTIEGLGRLDRWTQQIGITEGPRAEAHTVEEIVAAVAELSAGNIGAIIVIEKEARLDDIASNGVTLNAKVSAPLIVSIFYERNPLHDGAIIIRRDSIMAAACRLPLSDSTRLDPTLHLRHRAGVGVTEPVDAFAIIVSEERGTISIANEGRLRRLSSHLDLRDILNRELRGEVAENGKKRPRDRKTPVGSGR